jgi:uncharacterized repeat protein (TIGR02543 family)
LALSSLEHILIPATNAYSLTVALGGGTLSGFSADTKTFGADGVVPISGLFNLSSTPTKSGYTFAGWFYSLNINDRVDAEDTISGPTNITAVWTAITYTVTYVLDSGTNHVDNPATFTIEDLDITLEDATKADHTFEGWFTEAGFENEVTEITTIGNKTLYAKFASI